MHVLFVEPCFPHNQKQFVRALRSVGARVTGIGEVPLHSMPGEIREMLYGYEQVRSVVHEPSLMRAVERVQAREWVDRLEATVEAHIMAAAKVREARGIPGVSVKTSYLCRDKPAMKQVLRDAEIPCAQSIGSGDAGEITQFAPTWGNPDLGLE